VGTSFGVDRLMDVMEAAGLYPASVTAPAVRVLVARFGADPAPAVGLAAELRAAGVATEAYLDALSLGDQIRYALRRGIPYVAILGEDELAAGTVAWRNLEAGTQEALPRGTLPAALAS
jgi:histidyl-tRNA synthetase